MIDKYMRPLGLIPVGTSPIAMTRDPNEHKLYVVNERDDTISVIDENKCLKNCKPIQNITTGKFPTSISLDRRPGNLYVTSGKTNNVFITYAPVHPPKMDFAFDNITSSLYTLASGLPHGSSINKMNSTEIKSAKNIETPSNIEFFNSTSMATDSTGKKIYLANYDENSISLFDIATNNKKTKRFAGTLLHPFDLVCILSRVRYL